MRSICSIALITVVALGSSVCGSFAQTKPGAWVGYFVGGAGRAPFVEVDVFSAYEGQALFIDFMLRQASPERIVGALGTVTNATEKQFIFDFTDNEGNVGRGTFSRMGDRYRISLRATGDRLATARPPDLYGDYLLTRKAAVGRSDRHAWSWKKSQTTSK